MDERPDVAVEALRAYRVQPPEEPPAMIADAGRGALEGIHRVRG
jgi:hypothetical protein